MKHARTPPRREWPLTVKVEDGALVISIGADTLAQAFKYSPDGELLMWDQRAMRSDPERLQVTDPIAFTREIARALEDEPDECRSAIETFLVKVGFAVFKAGASGVEHRVERASAPAPVDDFNQDAPDGAVYVG